MLSARLLPVSWTFSALTTTTWSPQSICGVKEGLCLPRSLIAIIEASRPSTKPSASISSHFLSMSDGLAEKVFIARTEISSGRKPAGSARGGDVSDRLPMVKQCFVAGRPPQSKLESDQEKPMMTAMPKVTRNAPVLLEERADGVLRLTLNRPEAHNALSIGLMTALLEALGRTGKDPQTRV